jgi:hypothetical protein
MKAISSDNNRREMKTGRQMKKRKQKTKANSGKLLMTQTKAGVEGDVSVGPFSVLLVI